MRLPILGCSFGRSSARCTLTGVILLLWLLALHSTLGEGSHHDVHDSSPHSALPRAAPADSPEYLPHFPQFLRSIVGRQDADADAPSDLKNNQPGSKTITAGQTQYWRFPSTELQAPTASATQVLPGSATLHARRIEPDEDDDHVDLRRRAAERQLYITLNTCSQPSASNGGGGGGPPQLQVLVSWKNKQPGTGNNADTYPVSVAEGYAEYENSMSDDLFIAVSAPSATGSSGSYSYQIAGSIDEKYAAFQNNASIQWLDSDAHAALLVSYNLTSDSRDGAVSAWKSLGPHYTIFVHNSNSTKLAGLRHSYCALNNLASAGGNGSSLNTSQLQTGIVTYNNGPPVQQFYLSGLNRSSTYNAYLGLPSRYARAGSGVAGGGGTLWAATTFSTQADNNCQVVFNLTFCSNVGYAVPANPARFNQSALGQLYDGNASAIYQNFSYSLQQIPCNTSADAQYSLAVTCDDCDRAYRQWICGVTMPRCLDYASPRPYLQARNVAQAFLNGTNTSSISTDPTLSAANQSALAYNSSRNPIIDSLIAPGPYKELLPCGGLCYSLVQSCSSALGFACPLYGKGYNASYGFPGSDNGFPTCNIPGAIWGVSRAAGRQVSYVLLGIGVGVGLMLRL